MSDYYLSNARTYAAKAEIETDGNRSIVLALLAIAAAIEHSNSLSCTNDILSNCCEQLCNIDESLGKLR